MRKPFLFLTSLVLTSILACALTSASFKLDNLSITTSYGPGETLKGWMNISLQDESAASSLSAFESTISLLDFLKNNSLNPDVDFFCFPKDCKTGYQESNKELTKNYTLIIGDKKVVGLKIIGKITSVDSFSFTIQSDAKESVSPQVGIDIFNDGSIDWQSHNFSGAYGEPFYSCYNKEQAAQIAEITETEYCQRINISSASKLKLGADVVAMPGKGGNVKFTLSVRSKEDYETCTASASGNGSISCETGMNIDKEQELIVCISTERYEDSNKYGLYYEQNEPCGFSKSTEEYKYDFPIFVQQGKYLPIRNVLINQNEMDSYKGEINLAGEIGDYVEERYDNNCTKGCIIPVKILSGASQTLNITNVQLGYTTGISTTERYIYELSEQPAVVDIGFKKLTLEKSGIKVPIVYGKRVMSLKLGGTEIASRNIEVLKLAVIERVYPLEVTAVVPTKFYVYASGNITEYKWDFGDGTEIKTKENFTTHAYPAVSAYKLKISAINAEGESPPKEFDVISRSPKEEINNTLEEKRASLKNLTAGISKISGWYKSEVEKEVNVSNLEKELDSIEKSYQTSGDYVEIMKGLSEIDVPSGIESVKFNGPFLPFPESIDSSYLPDYKEEDSEQYPERIVLWMAENLELTLESEIFYLKREERREPLLTAFTVKIVPQTGIKEAFLIIEGDGIKFKEDYKQEELDGAVKIALSGEEKTIEFILPEGVEAIDLPLYISPRISKLPGAVIIGPCDNDGKCEKDKEENKENCPNDCDKINWPWLLMMLGILIFCTFVVYIILQEWYKRYYERHLFKNQNDLYNLMNFIFNALKQGKGKEELQKTLKQHKWKTEQIEYAFKKLLGKRTGMWEIPLFKAFEKKKVRQELAKRGQVY